METHLYKVIVTMFSRVGHTPITNRGNWFCDELAKIEFYSENPTKAQDKAKEFAELVGNVWSVHVYCPDFPNQNLRSKWI